MQGNAIVESYLPDRRLPGNELRNVPSECTQRTTLPAATARSLGDMDARAPMLKETIMDNTYLDHEMQHLWQ